MPRKKMQAASPLPEKFEDFEKQMLADEAPKLVEPKPDVRPIGGMVEGKWSGVRMWTCPRCRGTTFDEASSRVHVCKQVRYASDEDVPDDE